MSFSDNFVCSVFLIYFKLNYSKLFLQVLFIILVGDLDIELWLKEVLKVCRNFIQFCMEGYYNGIVFYRVVKDFIVQGGDFIGIGMGGELIYGKLFKVC